MVPSQMTGADLAEAGAAPSKINVIPYGADHLPSPDEERTAALLRRVGVGGEFLLSVGTLEPRKNLDRLVIAYGAARSQLPEKWPLLVVGPTGWKSRHTWVDPIGVHRLGTVDDGILAGLYTRARLLVYVPLMEGYGFPPLEAMQWGTPVLASRTVPSVTEVPGAEAAFVVNPTDVGSIEAGLLVSATDSSRRLQVVNRGTSLVRNRTWSRTPVRIRIYGRLSSDRLALYRRGDPMVLRCHSENHTYAHVDISPLLKRKSSSYLKVWRVICP